MLRKILIILLIFFIGIITGRILGNLSKYLPQKKATGSIIDTVILKPLEKYTIENLSQKSIAKESITLEKTLSENKKFTSWLFSMSYDPTLQNKEKKKVTGIVNIPIGNKKYPLVVLIRGFVDQKIYTSGMGSKKAGEYFANFGFLTIACDFLGYGESDKESENIFESRFQTYTTMLTLLNSLESGVINMLLFPNALGPNSVLPCTNAITRFLSKKLIISSFKLLGFSTLNLFLRKVCKILLFEILGPR